MKVYTSIDAFLNVKNPVLTQGTFDGVHIGHTKIIERLKKAAKEEDGETVLLTFSPHPRKVLFPGSDSIQLITTQEEKIHLLREVGLDHLIIYPFSREFSRLTATEYIRDFLVNQIGIKRLVIGYNHQFGRNRTGNLELLKELSSVYDFSVEEIGAQEINDIKVSSTKIRKAILEGNVHQATSYLGHSITLSGIVVRGNEIGKTLGFPTANIHISDKSKILPAIGVYEVDVHVDCNKYKGMLNIGTRPTVTNSLEKKVEVNIFEFDEDLYGKKIGISFVRKIRDEKKFESLDELKQQLAKDKQEILNRRISL